jgi:hypothetical protein
MNLCNFAKVIISRCTKDASTINWWNENACSSDDLKLDIPAHSQLITTLLIFFKRDLHFGVFFHECMVKSMPGLSSDKLTVSRNVQL